MNKEEIYLVGNADIDFGKGESKSALSLIIQYKNTETKIEQGCKRFLKELSNWNIRKEAEANKNE